MKTGNQKMNAVFLDLLFMSVPAVRINATTVFVAKDFSRQPLSQSISKIKII